MDQSAAQALAAGVAERVPALADELVLVIAEQNPGYRRVGVVSDDDLRRSCHDNMSSVLRLIGRDDDAEEFYAAARCTGRRRAEQRMPLDDVLRSFRLGGRLLWQALVDQARSDGSVDAEGLLEIATWLWEVVDSTSAHVAAAYHAAERQLVRIDEQRRATLWEGLLRGRAKDLAFAHEAARIIGVPVDGPYAVVVADASTAVGPVLAEHGIHSAWQLRAHTLVGLLSLDSPELGIVLKVLREALTTPAGVSLVVPGLADVDVAYRQATLARRSIQPGRVEVAALADRLPEALVLSSPELAEERRSAGPAGTGDDPEADAADQPLLEVVPGRAGGVGRRQHRTGSLEKQLARVGQVHAARVSLEQLHAQLGLQAPDLGRQARLGHPETFRGAREAALLGDRDEVPQVTQFHGSGRVSEVGVGVGELVGRHRLGVERGQVGAERARARRTVSHEEGVPPQTQNICNLAPVHDMIIGPRECDSIVTTPTRLEASDRLFICGGRSEDRGYVSEIRHGMEAQLGWAVPYAESSDILRIWTLEVYWQKSLLLVSTHPTTTNALSFDLETQEIEMMNSKGLPGLDFDNPTFVAALINGRHIVQVTTTGIYLMTQGVGTEIKNCGHKKFDCAQADIFEQHDTVAIARQISGGFEIGLVSFTTTTEQTLDINPAPGAITLREWPVSMCCKDLGGARVVILATSNNKILAYLVMSDMTLQLAFEKAVSDFCPNIEDASIASLIALGHRDSGIMLLLCGLRNGVLMCLEVRTDQSDNLGVYHSSRDPSIIL